jgi:hypothetical protein
MNEEGIAPYKRDVVLRGVATNKVQQAKNKIVFLSEAAASEAQP